MTIGIVGSGPDMLQVFRFLQRYDHQYIVYYDDLLRPYGDKPSALVQAVVADAIDVLVQRGCDNIILPPVWELFFRENKYVLPLFQNYLLHYCFTYTLVGKIGLVGDWSDIQIAQNVLTSFAQQYSLRDNQKNIKKFHQPFKRWVKEVPLRKYFLSGLSYSDPMVNKIVKFDLRYFKDAGVDTLIPINYGYFAYQNTISKFLNFKKCRFHKLEKLEEGFSNTQTLKGGNKQNSYAVQILYTGQKELLERQKRLMWMMQRGKQIQVQREKI